MDDPRFMLGRGQVHPRIGGIALAPTRPVGFGSLLDSVSRIASEIWSDWVEYAPLPDNVDTVRDAFLVLKRAELDVLETLNSYIARHNAGRMTSEEYLEYDGLRHDIHDRQVAFHGLLRQTCYEVLGRTVGDQVIARVPWPEWFPPLRPEYGQKPLLQAPSGLGIVIAPAVLWAGGILVAGILAAALLMHNAASYQREMGATLVAQARANALHDAVQMRERLYLDCVNRGGASAACMRAATDATSDAIRAIQDIRRQYDKQRRSLLLKTLLPMGIGMLAVAGLAVWIKVRRKRRSLTART